MSDYRVIFIPENFQTENKILKQESVLKTKIREEILIFADISYYQ